MRVDRYWLVYGGDGWTIETWQGGPQPENVVVVGSVGTPHDLRGLDAIVAELNRLTAGSVVMQDDEHRLLIPKEAK